MSWEIWAGPITPTTAAVPARVHNGSTPWPTSERQTAVQIGSWDVPDFDGLALCTEADPEAFFPEKGGSTKAAKAICRRCDVRERCLAWALQHDEPAGIWGGASPDERKAMRQRWAS